MSDAEDDDRPSDTMRERVPEDSRKFWLFLGADRWLVAGLILGSVFVAIVTLGMLAPTPAYTLLTRGDPIETLYQALVSSTITGVTLVLTLSQLVLSQELGAVGDQRERMEGAMRFRDDVADVAGVQVTPAEPSAVLRSLVDRTKQLAEEFGNAAETDGDDDVSNVVDRFVSDITDNADAVAEQLEGAKFGEFDVVWAALNYNYSWKLYGLERLRQEHGDALGDEANDVLEDLKDVLTLFGPAREHFKTLYFQWELSNLSRTLLYAAVPALVVSVCSLVFFDPRGFSDATLFVNDALLILAVTTTLSVTPFAILLSYILRIVTVTKRTLSIGPFILRETDRSAEVDWS